MAPKRVGEPATLSELLEDMSTRPESARVVFPDLGVELPYREVARRAAGASATLARQGVGPGEVVGMLIPASPAFLPVFFGVVAAGAAVSMLPVPSLAVNVTTVADHLARIVRIAAMKTLVVDFPHRDIAAALAVRCPRLRVIEADDVLTRSTGPSPDRVDPAAPAVVQFTSGSTGSPKGVVLSHQAVMSGLWSIKDGTRASRAEVVVQWVPLFHDMGLFSLLANLRYCDVVHLFTPHALLRRPGELLRYMGEVSGTAMSGADFAYRHLAAAARRMSPGTCDLSRWTLAINGSEPVDAGTVHDFTEALRPQRLPPNAMCPAYGLAECTLAVTMTRPGDGARVSWVDRHALGAEFVVRPTAPDDPAARALVAAGRPTAGVQVRIVAPDGTALREDAVGEIQVTGAPMTSGYLGDEQATAALFDGCWLRTGDLGFIADGDLFVAGRLKEMIIVHGRNFFAEDVEAVVREVPGVHRRRCVAVAGHERGREEIHVIVEVAAAGDGEEVRARIVRSVAGALDLGAVRVHIVPGNWLPRTTSGKWRRLLARELLTGARTPDTGRLS